MTRSKPQVTGPSASAGGPDYLAHLLVAVVAPLLVIAPPLRLLAMEGPEAAFKFFRPAAFTNLAIAGQSAARITPSFDGLHASNGFEPLWQFILNAVVRNFGLKDHTAVQLDLVLIVGAVLTAVGIGLFALATLRLTASPALSLLASVPGAFYLVTRGYGPSAHYGAAWSFVNGTETPLTIALFGTLFYWLVKSDVMRAPLFPRTAAVFGGIVAAMLLTRLDDAPLLIPAAYWGWMKTERLERRERVRLLAMLLGPAVGTLLIYMVFNLVTCGSILPRGEISSGLPLAENIKGLLGTFLPFRLFLDAPPQYGAMQWRAVQTFIPALAGLGYLAWAASRRQSGHALDGDVTTPLVLFLSAYAALKGLHEIIFVPQGRQGEDLFPVGILLLNLGAALTLAKLEFRGKPAFRSRTAFLAAIPAALYWAALFTNMKQTDFTYQATFSRLWNAGPRLREKVAAAKKLAGMVEFEDGIIGFALGLPTMHGPGRALDKEAARAKAQGMLLRLAHDRGFAALAWIDLSPPARPDALNKDAPQLSDYVRKQLQRHSPDARQLEKLDSWTFSVLFVDRPSGLHVIGFEPATPK